MKTPRLNASLTKVDDGDTARLLPDEDFAASYVGAGARNNTAEQDGAKPQFPLRANLGGLLHCTNSVAGELFLPNCCLGFAKATQRDAFTHQAYSAIQIAATFSVMSERVVNPRFWTVSTRARLNGNLELSPRINIVRQSRRAENHYAA
jgi:hypothetical protein